MYTVLHFSFIKKCMLSCLVCAVCVWYDPLVFSGAVNSVPSRAQFAFSIFFEIVDRQAVLKLTKKRLHTKRIFCMLRKMPFKLPTQLKMSGKDAMVFKWNG